MTRSQELVTAVTRTAVESLDATTRAFVETGAPARDVAEGVITGALEAIGKALGGDAEGHREASRLLVAAAMAYTRRSMGGASPEVCVMAVRDQLDAVMREFEAGPQ